MRRCRFHLILPALGLLLAASSAPSKAVPGDWPGWRGPDRTGLSPEKGLLQEWPKEGPKLLWKIEGLGDGYSTPSIAGGRLYVMGTKGGKENLFCLDLSKDGKVAWTTPVGSTGRGGYPGPRSTPTVDGDRVYALASGGKLICADTAKGEVKWSKDLMADFGGRHGNWAYAESPLVDGDLLICTPGSDSAALVALGKADGKVVWKTEVKGKPAPMGRRGARPYTTASYSSVVVAEIGGVRQYVAFLTGGVIGVDAKTGKYLWSYDKPANPQANAATPIVRDDTVFASSSYGVGSGRAKITKDDDGFKVKELYFTRQLANHHGGLLLIGDHVYGTGNSGLICLDYKTGEVAWTNRSVGKGSVAYADGHLYVRGEDGRVALVEAGPKAYKEKGRFDQPHRSSKKAWPHPVVVGGKLYLRDWDKLLCYDVKAK